MPYRDLREFLDKLEQEGELLRVGVEVDWNLEIGAVMRKAYDVEGPAVLFERIKDYPKDQRFFCGTLATFSKYALALGLPRTASIREITAAYRQRLGFPIPPQVIDPGKAPCKEQIKQGEAVDLWQFPTPFWHERDGGRYMGTFHCITMKDPDSAWVNVALYRMVVHDRNHLGLLMLPGQHGYTIHQKYEQRGQPMPVAIAIGQDPVNVIAAYGGFEAGVCEWEMSGALRQQAVELTPCETVDLLVPATAEIVIEGVVPPAVRMDEGPFGEYTGYYGGTRAPRPVVEVHCITHRDQPIHTGLLEGKPVQENNIMASVEHTALLEKLLIDDLRLGVKAVFDHPWAAYHGLIVALDPQYPGQVHQVAHAIWGSKVGFQIDYIFAVGADIDPTNLNEVLWAVCTRCKPDRDITILSRERSSGLWPCLTPEERDQALGSKILIDATFPAEWPRDWIPPVSDWWDYPEAVRTLVEARWKEYGFRR